MFESDCYIPAGTRYYVVEQEGVLSGERYATEDIPVVSEESSDAYGTFRTEDGQLLLVEHGDM